MNLHRLVLLLDPIRLLHKRRVPAAACKHCAPQAETSLSAYCCLRSSRLSSVLPPPPVASIRLAKLLPKPSPTLLPPWDHSGVATADAAADGVNIGCGCAADAAWAGAEEEWDQGERDGSLAAWVLDKLKVAWSRRE